MHDAVAIPASALLAAIGVAWLLSMMDFGSLEGQALVAVCAASLVATVALAAGWATEPNELERWVLRAGASAIISALPLVLS